MSRDNGALWVVDAASLHVRIQSSTLLLRVIPSNGGGIGWDDRSGGDKRDGGKTHGVDREIDVKDIGKLRVRLKDWCSKGCKRK